MPYKERDTEKLFYTIGEVAAMFKVNASLIRFWEKEFSIIKPQKNKKGNRLFTKTDIDNFHKIYHLVKERGYTLQGAKDKLRVSKPEHDQNMEVVNSLNRIRAILIDLKKTLQ